MPRPNPILVLATVFLLASATVMAQSTSATTSTTPSSGTTRSSSLDRLYINFIEDATIVDEQRWEGWFQYDDWDIIDISALYGSAAFQVWRNSEIGGRVGFGNSDSTDDLPDGTGATDLDLWGKYYWDLEGTELTAGAIATIPTGDDSSGLGWNAFSLKGFGAIRHSLRTVVLTGTLGLQANGTGHTLDSGDLDGELAFSAGAGVIAPWSDAFSFIGELSWKSNRFEGLDDDVQLLGGIDLRLSNRGMLRPAVSVGLQDGAPNWVFFVGYAYSF
jgi:hypothetical protein